MSRERYWGLYNLSKGEWIPNRTDSKNLRFETLDDAAKYAGVNDLPRWIVPCPFYVVRKPKSVSPALEKVLEAARRIAQWSPHPPGGIKAAIEEYDGKEYMYLGGGSGRFPG